MDDIRSPGMRPPGFTRRHRGLVVPFGAIDRAATQRFTFVSLVLAGLSLYAPASTAASGTCAESKDEQALMTCRKKEFRAVESDLDQLVAQIRKNFLDDGSERAATLAKAQSTWKAFRDADCKMQTYESRGSGYDAYLLACMTDMTRLRLESLKKIKDNP